MWLSRVARLPRKPFSEFDYSRHMPKEYVDKMRRTVPKKVFEHRFGAPAITQWVLHPDDYVPSHLRPWENEALNKTMERSNEYFKRGINKKKTELRRSDVKRLPDEEWTFFVGDVVQVMVGKDKHKQGAVIRVSRDTNEVLVDGLHTKLEADMENAQRMGIKKHFTWKEQPLSVTKGHVKLVDPNDGEPCETEWVLNSGSDEYIRVSKKSGFEIPVPSQAEVTYEYLQRDKYVEVEAKDTVAKNVLLKTYVPKLKSFEEEIMDSMGIKETRKHGPSYWY